MTDIQTLGAGEAGPTSGAAAAAELAPAAKLKIKKVNAAMDSEDLRKVLSVAAAVAVLRVATWLLRWLC